MDLETANNSVDNVAATDIERIVRDPRLCGEFAILSKSKDCFLQAAIDENKCTLEYRSEDGHFRATNDVTLDDVIAAFRDYLKGSTEWHTSRQWKELESRGGCLGMLLLTAWLIVPSFNLS